jgi:predicted ATPase/class 3 adenylate cyclase
VSDFHAWLGQLGLDKYAEAFEVEEVGLDQIAALSDADLKSLGLPLGPRRAILEAARGLAEETQVPVGEAPVLDAERRQITVMFCDLVGSTALAEQIDPEDLRRLLQAYQKACGTVMDRYGGHVAQYLGDGLMVYFGWPAAHEDDAERAVLAAIETLDAVKVVRAPAPLQVRIGIATGPVVVGETTSDATMPKLAVGETPNLAARLQGLAAGDAIVIAPATRRLIGGAIACEDMGEHVLRGIVEPVRAHTVLGPGAASGRFAAAHPDPLDGIVGRDSEIAMLLDRWQLAQGGEGQTVLLCGEPGIGKSRIVEELRQRIADEDHVSILYQCSAHHRNTALYPITDYFARTSGFDRRDTAEQKLDKLDALIAQNNLCVDEVSPLFALSLGIAAGDRYPALNMSPHRLRERTAEALVMRGVELSKRHTLLVVVEDAQWMDPTTEEALAMFVDYSREISVLLIATYRPEYEPGWRGHSNVTQLTLNRLGKRQAARLVDQVTGGKALPAEVRDQIVAKADGIPLFIEELTRTVLDSGLLIDGEDGFVLSGPLPELAVPMTLHDSLMARLDKLAPVKDLVQIGACIGRDFAYELLAAISGMASDALDEALDIMVSSGLVFRSGSPPDAVYTFKHMLIQETAHDALLKSRRQQIHAKIAKVLEADFQDIATTQPEMLATHYTAGGLPLQALPFWLAAGEMAVEGSANVEATRHLRQGLALIAALPESADRDRLELRFQNALSTPLIASRGYADTETNRTHARAQVLSERLGDGSLPFPALYGQCVSHTVLARNDDAHAVANAFLRLAEEQSDIASMVMGQRIVGLTRIYLGRPDIARVHLDRALGLYDPAQHHGLAYHYAQDPLVATLTLRSWSLLLLGFEAQSAIDRQRALAAARDLGHGHTLAYCLFYAGVLQDYLRRDTAALAEHAEQLATLCERQSMVTWLPFAEAGRSWIEAIQGDAAKGTAAIAATLEARDSSQACFNTTLLLTMLAEGQERCGEQNQAIASLDQALAFADDTNERWLVADILRHKGEMSGDMEILRQAVATARAQSAKPFEVRAATALARHWQSEGKTDLARDCLAESCQDITETHDFPALGAARALLENLGA